MLTSEQLQVIRECAKDDASFQRLRSLMEDVSASPAQSPLSLVGLALNLENDQVKLLLEVLDRLPVPVYVKDRDSRFILANRLTCEAVGVTDLENVIGKTDFDFYSAESAQNYFDAEQSLLKTGQPLLNFEVFVPEARGGAAWFLVTKAPIHDQNGHITGLVGINRDITERKLAESALAEERNILQTIIDHIPDKIYIKDRQSRFVLANRATWEAQQRFSSEQLVGTTDFDFMKSDRAQMHFDQEQALMESGQAIFNQELFVPEYLRGPLWFLVSKVPVYDEDGHVTGLVGINRDVTERKLAEQKVMELTLEQERSRILADFITDASHEFRTAVAIIQTSAYLLDKTTDYAKRQEHIAQIVAHLNRLVDLVDSLMTMLRLDRTTHLELSQTRLDVFLGALVERGRESVDGSTLKIDMLMDEPVPLVGIDVEKLDKALSNILNNAIRHTPDGGHITIRAFGQESEVVVEISDSGDGMTEEVQPNIFKRFYRADKAHTTSGFGLGLPIAQRIIELHQGRIEVDSVPDQGSTFRVILPDDSRS